MKPFYTAHAASHGGRMGQIKSDDGKLSLSLTVPEAMGGPGGAGTNPEQIFAGGYAACFHSAMQHLADGQKLSLGDSTVTGHVSIGQSDAGPGFQLAVQLEVDLPGLDQGEAEALVAQAHAVCPYSNAVKNNVAVDLTVRGRQPA
ncbi:MAG: organic hydroperoxide resistance protein [Oceanicaulis sp.]